MAHSFPLSTNSDTARRYCQPLLFYAVSVLLPVLCNYKFPVVCRGELQKMWERFLQFPHAGYMVMLLPELRKGR